MNCWFWAPVKHSKQQFNCLPNQVAKMKLSVFSILVVFAMASAFIACNRKTSQTATSNPPMQKPPTAETSRPEAQQPAKDAYQVAGYQKTACFGKCPVYQVKFYSDGKVTWYGQMNVERQGWYEAKVSEKTLKDIRDKSHELKYWDLSGKYPTEMRVADLPSTVTFVRAGDMEKTVVDTYQGPAELKQFEDYLAGIIDGLEWRPSTSK